jgi:hypothetical protein
MGQIIGEDAIGQIVLVIIKELGSVTFPNVE